jgi:3-dehydrosphinganine reductase
MLFLDCDIETMRRQMETNYWSCAYMAHEVLRAWVKPDSLPASSEKKEPPTRHLIFTASAVVFCGVAGYAPYAPSKSAIRSLADTLRSEMNFYNGARRANGKTVNSDSPAPPPADIDVHCVIPGTIQSPGLENENRTKHAVTFALEDVDPVQTPDECAAAAIKGLEKGEYIPVTNWLVYIMRAGGWLGSPRSNSVIDVVVSWFIALVWLYMQPDMARTVWNYGKKWGLAGEPKKDKKGV